MARKKERQVANETGRSFCDNTSIHGFCYWTLPGALLLELECINIISVCSIDALLIEKLFWVVMVLLGFISVSVMLTNAAIDWIKYPTRRMYNRSF